LNVTATPEDRSNSPPIISRATAHAMMPIVELAYKTVAKAAGERNGGATTAKNTNMATAPMTAPISGRSRKRCNGLRFLTRSSWMTL